MDQPTRSSISASSCETKSIVFSKYPPSTKPLEEIGLLTFSAHNDNPYNNLLLFLRIRICYFDQISFILLIEALICGIF
jgi:hypothetical protein